MKLVPVADFFWWFSPPVYCGLLDGYSRLLTPAARDLLDGAVWLLPPRRAPWRLRLSPSLSRFVNRRFLLFHRSILSPSSPPKPSSSFPLKFFQSSGYFSSIKMTDFHARRSEVVGWIDEDCLQKRRSGERLVRFEDCLAWPSFFFNLPPLMAEFGRISSLAPVEESHLLSWRVDSDCRATDHVVDRDDLLPRRVFPFGLIAQNRFCKVWPVV